MAILGSQTVVGIFDSLPAAEAARGTLLQAGIPDTRIALFIRSEEEKQYVEGLLRAKRAHRTTIRP